MGGSEVPQLPDTTSELDKDDAAALRAEEEERLRRLAGGRQSTIKTGPAGLTGEPTISKPTLLGGGM